MYIIWAWTGMIDMHNRHQGTTGLKGAVGLLYMAAMAKSLVATPHDFALLMTDLPKSGTILHHVTYIFTFNITTTLPGHRNIL